MLFTHNLEEIILKNVNYSTTFAKEILIFILRALTFSFFDEYERNTTQKCLFYTTLEFVGATDT